MSTTGWDDPSIGLDRRLRKAVARMGFGAPTPLQELGLRLLTKGGDVVIDGRTGEGKTVLYALSATSTLLREAHASASASDDTHRIATPQVLVCVPTRELISQTVKAFSDVIFYTDFKVAAVEGRLVRGEWKPNKETCVALVEQPHIIVGTPANIAPFLDANSSRRHGVSVSLSKCRVFIMDEADLLVTFGYMSDVSSLVASLPRTGCQRVMVSATASSGLAELTKLTLHSPQVVKTSKKSATSRLAQFFIRIGYVTDRYLLLYSLLKLKLIAGKTLVFVRDIPTAFKIKLFLERFAIPSAVLNSELPVNSRVHMISAFNRGLFDLLIATDEELLDVGEDRDVDEAAEGEHSGQKRKAKRSHSGSSSSKRARTDDTADGGYGVVRGVDFHMVSTVVNFDFPDTTAAYVHRVGRTARGGSSGASLSFVPLEGTDAVIDRMLEELQGSQEPDPATGAPQPAPLPFNIAEIEGFRYRVEDQLRGITSARIREARLADVRKELLASEALQSHFEDNPRDAEILSKVQHDKSLAPRAAKPHLKDVPEYLLPPSFRAAVEAAGGGIARSKKGKANKKRGGHGGAGAPTTMDDIVASTSRVSASTVVEVSKADAYRARRNNKDPLRNLAASRRAV